MRNITLLFLTICFCGITSAFASPTPSTYEGWGKVKAGALLIDVRTPKEFTAGHMEGAENIPHETIGNKISELTTDKSKDIVLYCQSGRRAGLAMNTLKSLGYEHVINAGGYDDIKEVSTLN